MANFSNADLREAVLVGAALTLAYFVGTDLENADLTGCHVYGVSAWGVKLERARQQNLIITDAGEPTITVDNIEVAQFIYLLLNNQKIRQVIDTITSKTVLILGRFTAERKAVLDVLREELRKRDYLPILFDFNVPATRDITETISLLARSALNLTQKQVADAAGISEGEVQQAETVGVVSPIRTIERISQALALDDRLIGVVTGAGADERLGVRLREMDFQRDTNRFTGAH